MKFKNLPLFSLLMVLMVVLVGCDTLELSDLVMRKGVAYKKGGGLFSGSIKGYFPQSAKEIEAGKDRRVSTEGEYKNGRKEGDWITYSWNGEKEVIPYENGKRHGLAKWTYANGDPKQEQWYANHMKHGSGTWYDPGKKVTKQVFYERNQLVNPKGDRRSSLDKLSTEDAKPATPGFLDSLFEGLF